MNIEIKSIKDVGPCNFCQRRKNIDVPGDVYEVEGNFLSFRMCENCMSKFIEKIAKMPMPKGI